jgi:hypothetical protein
MANKGGAARVKRLHKWMVDNEAFGLTWKLIRQFLDEEGERATLAAVEEMAYVTRSDYPEITFQLLLAVCGELREEKRFAERVRDAWEAMSYRFGVPKCVINEEN